jgi:hypothetical protein
MKALLSLFGLAALLLAACGKPQTLSFKTAAIPLSASGPLFEGANTAQGSFTPDIAAFLKQNGLEDATLEKALLKQATIILPDSLNSDLLSEITLQLASDAVDMQKVGVLNPVPPGQLRLDVQVAQEQEKIEDLLQQPSVLLVADVNLKKDQESDWQAQAVLEFTLTVKR